MEVLRGRRLRILMALGSTSETWPAFLVHGVVFVICWPDLALFGPWVHYTEPETETWPHFRPDRLNRDIQGTFYPMQGTQLLEHMCPFGLYRYVHATCMQGASEW